MRGQQWLGTLAKVVTRPLRRTAASILNPYITLLVGEIGAVDKGTQILLSMKYRELLATHCRLPTLEDVGFRAYSQNDEDGILLFIFSLLGTVNRTVVEVCAGDGVECNSANLIFNHGWRALLFDGNETNVRIARRFYARHRDSVYFPPIIVNAWIEPDNVDSLLMGNGFSGEVDLLCLDLDGVDFWIWKAIQRLTPRVVLAEYNWLWGPDASVTVPYRSGFRRFDVHEDYYGASLAALVKLGREKGYRLVGRSRYFNAIFIRNGVGDDILPEVSAADCLANPILAPEREKRLPQVMHYEWTNV